MYEDNRRPSPTGNQYPLGYGPAGSGYSQYPRQESRWREQPSPVYQETIGAQQDQVQTQPPSWYPPQGFPEPPKSFKLPDGSKWVYKKKKRFLPLKITLAVIFMLIIAVVVAAAIFINGYINDFNSRVESHQSSVDTIQNSLTPAEAGKPYYILLLGSDSREGSGTSDKLDMMGDNQRSDVMVLVRIDPEKNQLTLVSIPRDTRWNHDGITQKINEAYNVGRAQLATEVISNLVGVPISHVVEIKFSGLEGLVDSLGGVDVDVPVEISFKDALTGETVTVPEGHQHLNGKQAQIFARVRKAYSGQEATRQSNVRQLGSAILDSIRQRPVTEWPELGLKLADCVGSDMRFNDFVDLMKGLSENGELTIYSGTGPTAGDIDENVDGLWLCYDDPEGWARVMEVVDAGEDPAEVCAPYLELQASDTANVPQDPNAVPEGEGETAEGEWYPESSEGYYEEAPPAEGYDAAPAEGYGYTEY